VAQNKYAPSRLMNRETRDGCNRAEPSHTEAYEVARGSQQARQKTVLAQNDVSAQKCVEGGRENTSPTAQGPFQHNVVLCYRQRRRQNRMVQTVE